MHSYAISRQWTENPDGDQADQRPEIEAAVS